MKKTARRLDCAVAHAAGVCVRADGLPSSHAARRGRYDAVSSAMLRVASGVLRVPSTWSGLASRAQRLVCHAAYRRRCRSASVAARLCSPPVRPLRRRAAAASLSPWGSLCPPPLPSMSSPGIRDECLACSQIACNAAACHVTVLMWHAVCEPESLPVAAVGVSAALHNGCPALFMLRVGIWLGNVPHGSCCGSVRMGML